MSDNEHGWRIKEWSRPLARGVATCDGLGDQPFDGSVALVDDFLIGERVELELTRDGTAYRVTKIWPDDPHFRPPETPNANAPPLESRLEQQLGALLRDLPVSSDYRVLRFQENQDLVVVGADMGVFSYPYHPYDFEIRFDGVGYIELPLYWEGKSFRLASPTERDYLAGRVEMDASAVAVRIVDVERRIYFVVCAGLSWKRCESDRS